MHDILPDLDAWLAQGHHIAIATVIQTWGSSPRKVGARMAVNARGQMSGSVSGGCVEGAVVEAALQTLETGQPQLLHFGVADETAWEVGLACGGQIEVFVRPLEVPAFERVRAAIRAGRPVAQAMVIAGPREVLGEQVVVVGGEEGRDAAQDGVTRTLREAGCAALASGRPQRVRRPDLEVFADAILPPATLVIVGGVHISIALSKIAQVLGYRTVIVDPRRAFGSPERFPHADQLVQAWPDEALQSIGLGRTSAVAVLTHDPKLDDPALMVALPSPAFYVGALGSRNTQAKRRARLLEAGLTEAQLDRLHGPIGLDIHAQTPEEIGLAIMAEVVRARNRME